MRSREPGHPERALWLYFFDPPALDGLLKHILSRRSHLVISTLPFLTRGQTCNGLYDFCVLPWGRYFSSYFCSLLFFPSHSVRVRWRHMCIIFFGNSVFLVFLPLSPDDPTATRRCDGDARTAAADRGEEDGCMVGLAGGRKTGRGTREGQESGWSGADGREGGFGVLFFLGREGAGGRSFLRQRKPGFGTEGGESQWHGKQTPRRSSRLVWKSEFRALYLVDSLVSNLRGEKYQVGRVRRRGQLVRGGCPLFFLVCRLAHTHHESNAASFF